MGWDLSDLIKPITDVIGIGAGLYNNSQAQDQSSKQWDAQFAYQQQRDKIADAFAQEKLNAELGAAGMAAKAQVQAAGIAAGAQNRRTLADLYASYMQDLGARRKDQLEGTSNLAAAMTNPFLVRAKKDV